MHRSVQLCTPRPHTKPVNGQVLNNCWLCSWLTKKLPYLYGDHEDRQWRKLIVNRLVCGCYDSCCDSKLAWFYVCSSGRLSSNDFNGVFAAGGLKSTYHQSTWQRENTFLKTHFCPFPSTDSHNTRYSLIRSLGQNEQQRYGNSRFSQRTCIKSFSLGTLRKKKSYMKNKK